MALPAMTSNSPQLGSIAWAAFSIHYQGVSYSIPAGNTARRWVWWRFNGGGANSTIEAADELPTNLGDDDLVLFANKSGTPVRIYASSTIDGDLLVDGTVAARHLAADAITTELLLANDALITALETGSLLTDVLNGREINGVTITGSDIIGALIRTAMSGVRWELGLNATANQILSYTGHPDEAAPGALYVDTAPIAADGVTVALVTPRLGQSSTRAGLYMTIRPDGSTNLVLAGGSINLPTIGNGRVGVGGFRDSVIDAMRAALQMQSGVVSTGAFAGTNTPKDVAVTFPTPYPVGTVPVVNAWPVEVAGVQVLYTPSINNVTRTGFTIRAARSSGTGAYDMRWEAKLL